MLNTKKTILSVCLSCKDNLENIENVKAGKRFSELILKNLDITKLTGLEVRGVTCMSQCKRSCIISLTKQNSFTYIFGDINPAKREYIESLLKLISLYTSTSDGFLKRKERPELFQSNILGRLPPINTNSSLVSYLYKG